MNIQRVAANAKIATTVLGSIPASSDTAESEGRQVEQCRLKYFKNPQKTPFKIIKKKTI
jgi:hypothetical protein